jgi:GT2 family glycosyltransferase
MSISTEQHNYRLLTVIVVYERELTDVKSFDYLYSQLNSYLSTRDINKNEIFLLEQIIIYDNSKKACYKYSENLEGCSYFHNADNGGTAAAYTYACNLASKVGIDWLLLLDQDTALPDRFFEKASESIAKSSINPTALVPWVFHGKDVVSPARVTDFGTIIPLHYNSAKTSGSFQTAISSGSILYVPTLSTILPMPSAFWLDYVDHWIFLQLQLRGLPILLFDASLKHNLSVSNIESLSHNRLTSILNGEYAFIAMLGVKAKILYPFRLIARIFNYIFPRPDLAIHTIAWIAHRLRRSR